MPGQNTKRSVVLLFSAVLFSGAFICPTGRGPEARAQDTGEPQYPEQRLKAGDPIPVMEFEDINGNKGSTNDYRDWIVVFTFADRKSSKPLMEWMDRAWVKVSETDIDLNMVFFNVADLVTLPKALRGVVYPFLRILNDRSMKSMRKSYEKKGIDFDSIAQAIHFIPDDTGKFLRTFGLADGKQYQCFITVGHRVVAVFDPSTPDIVERYVETVRNLSAEKKNQSSGSGGPGAPES